MDIDKFYEKWGFLDWISDRVAENNKAVAYDPDNPLQTAVDVDNSTGVDVEDVEVVNKTGPKKTSTQSFLHRAQDIKDKYDLGEINRFQRNRLNRQLRQSMHQSKVRKKTLGDLREDVRGPVGKFVKKGWERVKDKLLDDIVGTSPEDGDSSDALAPAMAMQDTGGDFNTTPIQLNPIHNPVISAYQLMNNRGIF